VRLALHPGGRFLAVQHAGYRQHGVTLVDLRSDAVVAVLPIAKSWSGLPWSADGRRLHISGGVEDCLHVFSLDAENARCTEEPVRQDHASWDSRRNEAFAEVARRRIVVPAGNDMA